MFFVEKKKKIKIQKDVKMLLKYGNPVVRLSENNVYLYIYVCICLCMCVNKDAMYILD